MANNGPPPGRPWGPVEVGAVLGLTAGAFLIPVVGPLVGLTLAWTSDAWTRRDKTVATLVSGLPAFLLAVAVLVVVVLHSGSGVALASWGAP